MKGKCIKLYVTEEENKIIQQKAKDSDLSTSKYLKVRALKDEVFKSSNFIREFTNFSNDFKEIMEEYDIDDKDLKKINERINLICQNL